MAKTAGGKNTAGVVETLVRPVVEGMGLSLWDVRFEKEGPDWYLRVLIDKPDGTMDTDTCALVSHAIDPVIDEADPIDQSYFLEVGSPGLGRPGGPRRAAGSWRAFWPGVKAAPLRWTPLRAL